MPKTPIGYLQRQFHERGKPARNLSEYLEGTVFEAAYAKATVDEAAEVARLLDDGPLNQATYDAVKSWADSVLKRGRKLADYKNRELKPLCRRHGIVGWSRMSNDEMVKALEEIGVTG